MSKVSCGWPRVVADPRGTPSGESKFRLSQIAKQKKKKKQKVTNNEKMTETEEAAGSREERTTVSLATTSRTVLSRTPDSDHTSSPTITPVTPADNMDVCLMAESLHASKGTGSCAKLPRKTKGKERAPKDAVPDHVQLIHHFPQANALVSYPLAISLHTHTPNQTNTNKILKLPFSRPPKLSHRFTKTGTRINP